MGVNANSPIPVRFKEAGGEWESTTLMPKDPWHSFFKKPGVRRFVDSVTFVTIERKNS